MDAAICLGPENIRHHQPKAIAMRKFRLPPKPIAILALLALTLVPWVAGALMLRQALNLAVIGRLGIGGVIEVPDWLGRIASQSRFWRYSPEQRRWLGWEDGNTLLLGRTKDLAAAHPESLVIQTRWTLEQLAVGNLTSADRLAMLDKMERSDSGNSLWPLLRACRLMKDAATLENGQAETSQAAPAPWELKVTNQESFERGVAELHRALAMPVYQTYNRELKRRQLETLGPEPDFQDFLLAVSCLSGEPLPELGAMKQNVQFAQAYGKELLQRGQVEEARPLLRSWLPAAEKLLAADDGTLIGVLVAGSLINMGQCEELAWRAAGREVEAKAAAALWVPMFQPLAEFKKSRKQWQSESTAFAYRTGLMPAMLLPAIATSRLPEDQGKAWRQLEYLQVERQTGLVIVAGLWLLLLAGLLIYGFRQVPAVEHEPIPLGDWLRVVLLAILPVLIYFLIERNNDFHAKAVFAHWGFCMLLLLLAALLAWLLPSLFCRACRWLVGLMLLSPALLLLPLCFLMIFSLTIEEPQLIRQAKFMQPTPDGFTRIEADMANQLSSEMLAKLKACRSEASGQQNP
jgi:hypothetical protein